MATARPDTRTTPTGWNRCRTPSARAAPCPSSSVRSSAWQRRTLSVSTSSRRSDPCGPRTPSSSREPPAGRSRTDRSAVSMVALGTLCVRHCSSTAASAGFSDGSAPPSLAAARSSCAIRWKRRLRSASRGPFTFRTLDQRLCPAMPRPGAGGAGPGGTGTGPGGTGSPAGSPRQPQSGTRPGRPSPGSRSPSAAILYGRRAAVSSGPRCRRLPVPALLCQGLDLETPTVFLGDANGGFGATVAQFGTSDDGWILVGAPLERGGPDESGAVYQCRFRSRECQKLSITGPDGAVNSSLGLALAAGDDTVLVCGPTSPQTCGVNVHLNGFCVQLDSALQQVRKLPKVFRECPKAKMDIAFLMDGSGSISPRDFLTMKRFIIQVMRLFHGADARFSLTQFSSGMKDHFDFNTFWSYPYPELLLRDVHQLRGTTHTATGIKHVLERMFVSGRGARPDARWILIVVTDGEKTGDSLEYSDVIPLAEHMGVTRYAIGVGRDFQTARAQGELRAIASSPTHDHLFRVDNFDALANIQNQLQEKIFAIEGTSSARSSSFQLEMAQEGISALLTSAGAVLGAVGAFDWSGGAFVYGGGGAEPTFVNGSGAHLGDLEDMRDAYLGYSLAQVSLSEGTWALALGAPRFAHLGKVLLLTPGHTWTVLAEATGTQVGSYFGASLLALAPPSSGRRRPGEPRLRLLVGAPFYYGGGSGGRVELCELRQVKGTPGQVPQLRCHLSLRGSPGQPLGQFGASLAHLGDLDGDRWAEVAVGAPLEDDGRGAVYLFRGSPGGVRSDGAQRIPGSAFPSRPDFFGQSLSGGRDLSGDQLPDLAVGARGQVLLLRAPPLLQVRLQVTFQPSMVPAAALECPEGEELRSHLATATLRFTGAKKIPDGFGSGVRLSLWFRAELDPGRVRVRATFGEKSAENGSVALGVGSGRHELQIFFKECPRDTLTPLGLRVTLGGRGRPLEVAGGLRPQISPDSDTVVTASLPFEHDCGTDNVCQDELHVGLNFSGLGVLVVGASDALEVTLMVTNEGESSFGAVVTLTHPAQLSYRKVELIQASRRSGSLGCHSEPPEGRGRRTLCQVQPPVLRAGTQVIFKVTLDVPPDADLGDLLEVTATTSSENGGAGGRNQSAAIPVRYQVFLVLASGTDSTRYLNVTTRGATPAPAPVTHHYQVKVLGQRGLPANVTFWVPTHLGREQLWEQLQVTPEQAESRCREGPERRGDTWEPPPERPRLVCPGPTCREFTCALPHMEPHQVWGFKVGGKLRLDWLRQQPRPKLHLVTSAQVTFDPQRFHNPWGTTQLQVQTELERVETPNPLPWILGASLGGLLLLALVALGLYKVGFFKRRYKEMLEETPGEPQGEEIPQKS